LPDRSVYIYIFDRTAAVFTAYASEAGNAMLKWLPTGGFYITGGIAAKNLDRFTPDSGV
jgi:glucokinase